MNQRIIDEVKGLEEFDFSILTKSQKEQVKRMLQNAIAAADGKALRKLGDHVKTDGQIVYLDATDDYKDEDELPTDRAKINKFARMFMNARVEDSYDIDGFTSRNGIKNDTDDDGNKLCDIDARIRDAENNLAFFTVMLEQVKAARDRGAKYIAGVDFDDWEDDDED
jgi:hypothetical protein